jgi:hypothetical protein
MESTPSPRRPKAGQVVLGLFVCWQLFYLPASNYLGMLPHGAPEEGELSDSRCISGPEGGGGPIQHAVDFAAEVTTAWAQLSGQQQAWWLFAPGFPGQATFPEVELRWDNPASGTKGSKWTTYPPVRLQSTIEPVDPQNYVHLPGSFDRLFHYEVRLGLVYLNWDQQSFHEQPEPWRQLLADRVRRQWRSMRAYLNWRVLQFSQEHGELPLPAQAILLIRIYRTPALGEDLLVRQDPVEQPLARWQPQSPSVDGYLPVEAYDPVSRDFVRVKQ